jgi:hypothetical protein
MYLVVMSDTLLAQPGGIIVVYKNAPSPVRHAAERLSTYSGLSLSTAKANAAALRIELNATKDPKIEPQGYTIQSANKGITVSGNDAEGAANGVYKRCVHPSAHAHD